MNFKFSKLFLLMLAVVFGVGCKTTSPTVRVNKTEKQITVYSSSDKTSALADLTKSSEIQSSREVLQQKLAKDPSNVGLLLDLANIDLVQGKFKEANDTCRKALSYNLKNANGRKLLGRIELESGHPEKAEIIFNSLGGPASKDSDILNLLGIIALKKKEYAEAFDLFNRGVKVAPDNIAIRMNLGTLQLKFSQVQPASVQFERVLQIIPDHPDALLHLGIAKTYRGEYAQAEELYKRVLKADSANPIVHFNMALAEKGAGSLENALGNVKVFLKQQGLSVDRFKAGQDLRAEIESDIAKKKQQEEELKKQKQLEKQQSQKQTLSAKPLKEIPEPATDEDAK